MKLDPNATPTARRIHKRGMQKKASFISGDKFPGLMQCESMLEADFVQLALLDPRVTKIESQPFCIELVSGNIFPTKAEAIEYRRLTRANNPPQNTKIYTPDFRIYWEDSASTIYEVRHSRFLHLNSDALNYPAVMNDLGLSLTILTDAYLRSPVSYNAHLLKRYVDPTKEFQISSSLAQATQSPCSIRDLTDGQSFSMPEVMSGKGSKQSYHEWQQAQTATPNAKV